MARVVGTVLALSLSNGRHCRPTLFVAENQYGKTSLWTVWQGALSSNLSVTDYHLSRTRRSFSQEADWSERLWIRIIFIVIVQDNEILFGAVLCIFNAADTKTTDISAFEHYTWTIASLNHIHLCSLELVYHFYKRFWIIFYLEGHLLHGAGDGSCGILKPSMALTYMELISLNYRSTDEKPPVQQENN